MKVDFYNPEYRKIEIGDLIEYEGELAILAHESRVSISGDCHDRDYPYVVVSLDGKVKEAFNGLDSINRFCRLVCKNKDIQMLI